MKLSQEQIEYIDAYLIKNKVKYWDVRMELLDHIALAIQDLIKKGLSFDEALQEAHLSFGNKIKFKKLSKDQKEWIFTESIYADDSGYKKLVQSKSMELQKGLRKSLGQELLTFIKTPFILVIYLLLFLAFLKGEAWLAHGNNFFKVIIIPLAIISAIPLFFGITQLKKSFRSLYLSSLTLLPLLTTSMFNLMLNIPKGFIMGEDKTLPYWYLLLIYGILAPLTYVEVKLYLRKYFEYKKIYKKYFL